MQMKPTQTCELEDCIVKYSSDDSIHVEKGASGPVSVES